MKLTIKQDNLAKALNSIGRIATARAGLPILANVLIRTDGNKLIVAATNLEVAITTTIGAQVEDIPAHVGLWHDIPVSHVRECESDSGVAFAGTYDSRIGRGQTCTEKV